MAIYTNLPLYEDSYQLLLCLVSFSRNMQRDFRYTLGEQVKDKVVEISPGTGKTCRSTDCHKATEFLKIRLGLEVHTNKITIYHANHGVSFLGAYLKPHRCYIHTKTLSRLLNCLKKVIKEEKPIV